MRHKAVRKPLWGEYPSFTIGKWEIGKKGILITFEYRNKQKEIAFPGFFYLSKEKFDTLPDHTGSRVTNSKDVSVFDDLEKISEERFNELKNG